MFSITINGNTPEELFANIEKALAIKNFTAPVAIPEAAPTVNPFPPAAPAQPYPMTPQAPIPATTALVAAPATMTPTPTATTPPPATPAANPAPAVPAAAPTYTLDALARAGAALAQSGKMQEALALLAKYGVQTVNQLKPEQYGAFATELRALGAQV